MAKYVYPAIFMPEENAYSIFFPDFTSCYTSAPTLAEGMAMANDVLCLTLYDMEENGQNVPTPSNIKTLKTEGEAFATLISCDTLAYRQYYDNQAVKKTLTIPSWLNNMAEKQGINFSATLQNALKQELHL